jgi:hypothetical protein
VKAAGNPWMKFYPSDWRADPALRSCTIAARGLWVEMLCIMHEATPYGSLLINGARIDKKRLAALAGILEKECTLLLLELEGFGVFSRDDDGTIYSRRMRRDYEKALEDKRNGGKGGNPKLKGGVNPQDNGEDKAQKPYSEIDRIGSASANAFTEGSKALATAFWKALGFNSPLAIPPEFAGIDWRALEWERAGWTVDLIDTEARKIGPAKPLSYHEKCFATAFAKRQAPLPIVEISEQQTIKANHGNRTGNTRTTGHDAILAVAARKARELDRNDQMAGPAGATRPAFGDGIDRPGSGANSDAPGPDQRGNQRFESDDKRIRQGEIIPPDKDVAGVPGRW